MGVVVLKGRPELRFDDRLQTLLDAPVADHRDRAVRWRQLVDLLSRLDASDGGETVTGALALIKQDAFAIDEAVRAATLRGISGRRLPLALLKILATQPVRIAAPLFAGLALSSVDAAEVLAEADPDVRSLVSVEAPAIVDPVAIVPAIASPATPSIGDMVDRIEQLTKARAPTAPPLSKPSAPPRPPPARAFASQRRPSPVESGRLFEWESDASGHVAWVEGAPRGAFVGRPLGGDGVGLLDRTAASRIGQRHPFVDVPLTVADTLDGEWSATGVPAFDPANGRFLGYRGLARRTDGVAERGVGGPGVGERHEAQPDLDALREMVHEIKTPLNAIIGFAEIIDGQYLGPAHRRYRERASVIVAQARQLLEAVEDLDFAAKLRADRHRSTGGGRLSELFPPIAAEVERCLAANGAMLVVDIDDERHRCALSAELATRLLRRFLLSLCEHVGAGEPFRMAVSRRGRMCLLTLVRPRALDGIDEAQLVDPGFDPRGERDGSLVGLGFALRLVRGLARVAGGDLRIDEHRLTLELPARDS